jgi:hypothetical protein
VSAGVLPSLASTACIICQGLPRHSSASWAAVEKEDRPRLSSKAGKGLHREAAPPDKTQRPVNLAGEASDKAESTSLQLTQEKVLDLKSSCVCENIKNEKWRKRTCARNCKAVLGS